MPATVGIAMIFIAGKARSYAARLSCFVVAARGDCFYAYSPRFSYHRHHQARPSRMPAGT